MKILISFAFFLAVFVFFAPKTACANDFSPHLSTTFKLHPSENQLTPGWQIKLVRLIRKLNIKGQGGQKAMAVGLAVGLGPFGVHRLYLGTEPVVPVFYALTLGGGFGLLPLCDIVAILLSKDLDAFKNSKKFIVWGGDS